MRKGSKCLEEFLAVVAGTSDMVYLEDQDKFISKKVLPDKSVQLRTEAINEHWYYWCIAWDRSAEHHGYRTC